MAAASPLTRPAETPTTAQRRSDANALLLLQVSIAAMGVLGTLLLGLGQRNMFLPAMAIVAAITSVIVTDNLKRFRLNHNLASIAALIAVVYSLSQFDRRDSETQLLAIANLLVYLQIVLLFEEKNIRIYWALAVLSLLQVVVAAALNLSASFGLLLLAYLIIGLVALSVLFAFRESLRFSSTSPLGLSDQAFNLTASTNSPVGWSSETSADSTAPLVGKLMRKHIFAMSLLTFVVTVLLFFGVPRFRKASWEAPGAGLRTSGFSREVSLNRRGRIMLSDELVMRVAFTDYRTDQPFVPLGETYFRGAVLTRYSSREGRWSAGRQTSRSIDLRPAASGQGRIRQHIALEPYANSNSGIRQMILFSTFPVFEDEKTPPGIEVNPSTQQLFVDSLQMGEGGAYRYTVRTGAFQNSMQSRLTSEPNSDIDLDGLTSFGRRYSVEAESAFEKLTTLSDEIVKDIPPDDRLAKALTLEAYFHRPGLFEYSLDPDVVRSPSMDPIEDFVLNHRTGHCEFFASALVLMLRSQNIPARMVIGYRGGDFNSVGDYYQVRQKNAHAWVEAYLEPGQFDENQLTERPPFPSGAWLRLDPTPADEDVEVDAGVIGLFARLADASDFIEILWTDYVVGLNSQRQQESIYQPVAERFAESAKLLAAGDWRTWLWTGLILLSIIGSIVGVSFLIRLRPRAKTRRQTRSLWPKSLTYPWRILVSWWPALRPQAMQTPGISVAFYERFEKLLARRGIRRQPQQTPREFATSVGGMLADRAGFQPVAGTPRRVVEAYYRVRYGGFALDAGEAQFVEQALAQLDAALLQHQAKK